MKLKLTKPIKPNPPKEPVAPQRVVTENHEAHVSLSTLEELIQFFAEYGKNWPPGRRAMPVQPSEVKFGTDDDYGSSYAIATWPQVTEIELTDTEFAAAQAKYEKALLAYALKSSEYRVLSARYEADLKTYEVARLAQEDERELELLHKLAAKRGIKL